MTSVPPLRALLLVLIACWLPLQAVAAWAMPLCAHAGPPISAPCDHAGAQALAHGAEETPAVTHASTCSTCGVCQLASSGFLLAAIDPQPALPGADALAPHPQTIPRSHIADPPRHPPRHRA